MKALYLVHKGGFNPSALQAVREVPGLELTEETGWEDWDEAQLAERIREFDIYILSRSPHVPDELASNPGNLKWVCYLHGGIKGKVSREVIKSSITITNWGDHTAVELSEGSFVLMLCCLKDVHTRIMNIRNDVPRQEARLQSVGGTLKDLRVGVYGYGFAGRAFVDLIRPIGPIIKIFDPYATGIPEDCTRVDALEDLFEDSQVLVVHAALTPETRGTVSRELLAKLPDGGIVVNTARGAIIDQDALFDELRSGRLRAGLDVLDPDHLPEGHEARKWENLIYGSHCFSQFKAWPGESPLTRRDVNVIANLKRFIAGEPLQDVITPAKYDLMT